MDCVEQMSYRNYMGNQVIMCICGLIEMEDVIANKQWMCPHCIEEMGTKPFWICNRFDNNLFIYLFFWELGVVN